MSDLCSPMIILLDDEADAFWCFERLMRRLVYIYNLYLNSSLTSYLIMWIVMFFVPQLFLDAHITIVHNISFGLIFTWILVLSQDTMTRRRRNFSSVSSIPNSTIEPLVISCRSYPVCGHALLSLFKQSYLSLRPNLNWCRDATIVVQP